MSGLARLSKLAAHFKQSSASSDPKDPHCNPLNFHTLSPTHFLPRAASIEPDAEAIHHVTSNGKVLKKSYQQFADRARGLAFYIRQAGYSKVGILCPNTPAFLESLFGIAAAGAVSVGVNYRLKTDDIAYIFDHAEVDSIIVDAEFLPLLDAYKSIHPAVPLIVDTDTCSTKGQLGGPFDEVVLQGLNEDVRLGNKGWRDLQVQVQDEQSTLALAYTSGTTARPKGVMCNHRGTYLASMAGIIESGLNFDNGRCRYLWTLPMFHAMGWTYPWAVTAVRGTHYCLRKIDYPNLWKLLKEEHITHYNAAPTVNRLLCNAREASRLPRPVRVTVAGSPPTPYLFELMISLNLHPVHVYGLTETYGPITKGYFLPSWDSIPLKQKYQNMARQGYGFITSLPIRVIKPDMPEGIIVDIKKDGKEIGEIVFEGNICASGYYKDPEATRKLFAGGVLHSGDLAVWHPDGSAQIVDRAKDIIISGGENISSVALESMLITHPSILEAGVVAMPDPQWGERPKAFITIKSGCSLKASEVLDWAKHQSEISRFMVPREVQIIEELPKTSTGKVKKKLLREWARRGKAEGG
ncbi:MAG: Acyl-CoA synthetase member 3, mitochondrial [Trizodia sp. TS-e1964]|nr:MAG: Acyl-CoA synthetase member 3, mitochondrial [Trizodia sp. TS-e1964]